MDWRFGAVTLCLCVSIYNCLTRKYKDTKERRSVRWCRLLLANNLDQHSFPSPPIKLVIEKVLPRAQM